MTQFPVITPTEEREYLRKARERRFEQRIRTLNALWWASQENNLSRSDSVTGAACNAKAPSGLLITCRPKESLHCESIGALRGRDTVGGFATSVESAAVIRSPEPIRRNQ